MQENQDLRWQLFPPAKARKDLALWRVRPVGQVGTTHRKADRQVPEISIS